MANMLFANNCNTTLASSLTSGATSMSVTSATGFPSPTGVQYFYCTLADAATQTTIEIVKVTSVTGTTFAITRAQDGTSATAFAAGAVVSLRLVRASLNDFPKLSETNTFNADQSIVGALTTSAGLVSTNTFTATPPSDGLVMDYATGFGRFSAFAGDGFQWYNAGVANTKLMQLSSTGVITTATWNGATVTVPYGGTGLTSFAVGDLIYADTTTTLAKLADVATGNALISGGVGVAPSYGKIGLTTHISGTLAVGNGGTGVTTSTGSVNTVLSTSPTLTTPIITTTIGVGGATPSASGSGITFPATQSASTDVNTLDDYEEGTFAATFLSDGGSITTDATIRYGFYTKIGRQVTITCNVKASAISSPTGDVYIFTLPFANSSTTGAFSTVAVTPNNLSSTAVTQIIGSIPTGASYIVFGKFSAGSLSTLSGQMQANTSIIVTATYFTAT